MKAMPPAYCFTKDDAIMRRVQAYAPDALAWRCYKNPDEIRGRLDEQPAGLLCIDLRVPSALDYIARWQASPVKHAIIALGAARSDPQRAAEEMGVYATLPLEPDATMLCTTLAHALDRLQMQREVQRLREQIDTPRERPGDHGAATTAGGSLPLPHLARALRRFDNPAALLAELVEGVASSMCVARAGLFAQDQKGEPYTLQADQHCLEAARELTYPVDHPLVRFLKSRAHLVARCALPHVPDPDERFLLRDALSDLGAEILCPLFARGHLTGWLFLGQRATGVPFANDDLEAINALTDQVAITLDNAKLYEEVNLQKTLAEVLFHSIPIGVAAVDQNGLVRWCNAATERMLGCGSGPINQPVAQLGSRLADHLNRACRNEPPPPQVEWKHPATQRQIRIQTHRLIDPDGHCLGAVALLHDITEELHLKEKQDQVERTAFWTELAASMSHEIRNPLVAIKTFAQLLPERFNDEDFRREFSQTVTAEVERLDDLIEQIDAFANPSPLQETDIDLPQLIENAMTLALGADPENVVSVQSAIAPRCPPLRGDPEALQTGLAHLVLNAIEACQRVRGGHVEVQAEPAWPSGPTLAGPNGALPSHLLLRIKDNGDGIPETIREKLFSPFCTTKARGMGLGLAIARRVAIDHDGHIEVDSSGRGTNVEWLLPAAS